MRVLVVGESWIKHTIHMKGFDHFQTTEYEEGGAAFLDALAVAGFEVTYVRGHEVSGRFPSSAEELSRFDAVVLSDIGANSFLLTDETFLRSRPTVNRLQLIADFVQDGGGLLMIGGYLSFAGIDGRARYGQSPLAAILPVGILDRDDRVERPEGVHPEIVSEHPAIAGAGGPWPRLLGYNQLTGDPGAQTIVRVGKDPLLVLGEHGAGRTAAFASDCAPHWAPPEFMAWPRFQSLWGSLVGWVGGGAGSPG